ncbi:hypothetical protein R1sor_004573 [Riccia sorocarpa]|uniref:DDE Tnp4 domain-containing protein n=1 Tax=Riccia sorocarpa TaxID=122646 RepID=A0ABD3GGH1_9MARC
MDFIDFFTVLLLYWDSWDLYEISALLLTEEEDSDSSYVPLLLCNTVLSLVHPNVHSNVRRWWIFPKSYNWWNDCANGVWTGSCIDCDRLWRERFRMKYPLFLHLCNEIEPYMPPIDEWPLARKRVELEKAVAVVLWRLGRNETLLEISDKFHIGQATIVKYTTLITHILASPHKLFSKYVGLPRGARFQASTEKFYSLSKLPLVVGCIDGSYIKLRKKPKADQNPAEYWNRHHDHAVLLQGLCDADLTERRVRGRGSTRRTVQEETVVGLRPYIIGDAAYPLTSFLMKAFDKRRNGEVSRNNFDKALRRSRVRIEHTFGLLKNRWRIVDTGVPVKLEEVSNIVMACVMLHNFINYKGRRIPDTDRYPNLVTFDPFIHSEPHLNVDERIHLQRSRQGKLIQKALYQNWIQNV